MSDETTFCDHCAKPLAPSEVCAFGSCPVPTDSTNAGESAQLCEKCCESFDLIEGYQTDDGLYWCRDCLAYNLFGNNNADAPDMEIPKEVNGKPIFLILDDADGNDALDARCNCCGTNLF